MALAAHANANLVNQRLTYSTLASPASANAPPPAQASRPTRGKPESNDSRNPPVARVDLIPEIRMKSTRPHANRTLPARTGTARSGVARQWRAHRRQPVLTGP